MLKIAAKRSIFIFLQLSSEFIPLDEAESSGIKVWLALFF